MKKFAVMVLAVMLVGVMAAGAYARVELDFSPYKTIFYVGEEVSVKVTATLNRDVEVISPTYSFEVRHGELPPDCELKQYGSNTGTAYITGKLTEAGNYDFTVWVTVKGLLRSAYGYTRTFEDAGTLNGEMYIITPENPTVSDDIGDNISKDTPAPISDDIGNDTSKDIPAPVPTPKPEVISVIAPKLGTTADNMSYIASSDMAAPQAPTSRITGALDILGLEIISTQGSLNVSQSGYYAFPMTVPANLVGTNTKLAVYVADRNEFGESSFNPSAVTLPLTMAEIFTESGEEVTTLPKTIIAAANLGADTARTFSTHIAKASSEGVSSSGGGGGCNSLHALAIILAAILTFRKSRR